MELAAEQQHAKNGHQRQSNGRRAHHRKGLGKSKRMKELALLPGQSKHGHKGQNDDRHREERWTANQLGGPQNRLEDSPSIARIDSFQMSKGIFGDDNAR